MVDITRFIKDRTWSGYEYRVYATDHRGKYPISGAIRLDGRWLSTFWNEDGCNQWNGCKFDLIPIGEDDRSFKIGETAIIGFRGKTIGGYPIRIYATDHSGRYNICGGVLVDGSWEHIRWTESGYSHRRSSDYNLVAIDAYSALEIGERVLVWTTVK